MELLDSAYLNDLVVKAQRGSSNAFAELFAATYQRQYVCSFHYLHDARLARDALKESYVRALKNIGRLQNPDLFIAWLNRINFRVCYEMQKKKAAGGGNISHRQEFPGAEGTESVSKFAEAGRGEIDSGRQKGYPESGAKESASKFAEAGRGEAYSGRRLEDEVLEVDSRKYILTQVWSLPLAESQAILMKYYHDMTLDEIGDAMNISRSTVKRYLRSGKKHLQKSLY